MFATNKLASYAVLSIIMALTIFVLNILKNTKDTLIVSTLGAELISTIKLFGVLPAAFISVLLYTKLSNYLTRSKIYHFFNLIFNGFFLLFAFALYPNATYLHLDLTHLTLQFPLFRYQIIMVENWTYSLFYIMAELWGNVMLSLMFWQVMNQVTKVKKAKWLYPRLMLFGEAGFVMAGVFAALFTSSLIASSWDNTLRYTCISTFIAGCLISILFYFLCNYMIGLDKINDKQSTTLPNTLESLKGVLRSPHIRKLICILVCYGACINLVEGVWKAHLKLIYPSGLEYGHYMALIQIFTGVLSICSVLLSAFILPKLSWVVPAALTPIVALILGFLFFVVALLGDDLAYFNLIFLAATAGAIHNILTKATKFAFFEPTKEMVFISLNQELRSKGKGAADILGERLGKSTGAAVQWIILTFTMGSSLISVTPILFAIFIAITAFWLFSVYSLNQILPKKLYN